MLSKLWLMIKRFPLLHSAIKKIFESSCELIPPLRRIIYNLGTSPTGLDFGTGDMAKDWNLRSRKNAKWYIYWDACKNEDEFNASGEKEVRDIVLKNISLRKDARVLEIGSGVGRLLKPLSGYVNEIYGVDISQEMIRQANERLKNPNIFLYVTDGTLSAFADNYFDLCYSLAVFRHIPEKKFIYQYLSEASRVLKPEGVLRFEVWGAHSSKSRDKGGTIIGVTFNEHEMRAKLEEIGFAVLNVEERPELPYIIYTAVRKPKNGVESTKALNWVDGNISKTSNYIL